MPYQEQKQIYQACEAENAPPWNFDLYVESLLDNLIAHHHDKVLMICAKAEIALQLKQVLRKREAICAAVFQEELSIIKHDRAAVYFAIEVSGVQVLLYSEIGSKNRNFSSLVSCRCFICYSTLIY